MVIEPPLSQVPLTPIELRKFDYSGLDAAMLYALRATKVGIMFAASGTTRILAKPAASSCAVISDGN